ncbi:MAG: Transposase DDE domain protein [Deltaproteobacteria bacterium ADurb.Bin151]|jgi:transposase|nr:MAG: Transposase DDE domain protein [Deltaproteobacteria bacterium ADurb.Bin151]
MFIKTTTNSAGQTYYHLVESYRLNGKVKHRTLLSLGKAGEDRMDELIAAISRHKEILTLLELAKSIDVKDTYILGPLLVLERLFEKSGINPILESIAARHPKLALDLRGIVFTLVAARFVQPGSKLKVFEHWQKRFYPEMVTQDIGLHQLYRTLDLLSAHKDEIEKALFWRDRDLLSPQVDVILYDLTTLRFESTRTDLGELRQFGYSKERRSDCTQVVLGLLVTPEGIPIGFEVYPGNTFEGKTIKGIVAKLREKFSIRRFIFVGDRGLFSKQNLTELRGENKVGEFIVGMKLAVFKKRHEEFYDIGRYQWLNDDLAVYETNHEGDRCIITWSRSRAERDRKSREDVLDKIRKKLSKKKITAKEFVTNTTYQRYVSGLNDNRDFTLNEKAIAQDATRDGYFGVVTNVLDMDAKEIVADYKTLWIVEDAFGEIKGTLRARPVFHWTDPRIVGHLTLCFIAYYCESLMTQALREKKLMLENSAIDAAVIKPRPLTVLEAMSELQEVRAVPVTLRSTTMWVRTDIHGNAHKLFSAIGLKPPPKVLHITKSENVVAQA